MPEDRESCLYCGWNADGSDSQPDGPPTTGEFRQGVTLWRLAVFSAVLLPYAYFQLPDEGPVPLGAWAIVAACVVLGPVVFALQLWRRYQGGIELKEQGLEFESGEFLDFRQIEATTLFTGLPTDLSEKVGEFAIGTSGLARFMRILFMGKFGVCLIAGPVMALAYFIVPAVGLLTPFHSRIVLHLANGEQRVLHDLDEYWALYLAINSKLRREPAPRLRAA